jgi:hypothetical protein
MDIIIQWAAKVFGRQKSGKVRFLAVVGLSVYRFIGL